MRSLWDSQTSMLASLVTSHSKIRQEPDSATPAQPHSCEAFVGSRTVASTWSPRARSCRTHSRPMPLLAPTMTHVAGLLHRAVISIRTKLATKCPYGCMEIPPRCLNMPESSGDPTIAMKYSNGQVTLWMVVLMVLEKIEVQIILNAFPFLAPTCDY